MSIVFAEADGFHRGQNTLLKTLYAIISLCSYNQCVTSPKPLNSKSGYDSVHGNNGIVPFNVYQKHCSSQNEYFCPQ
jgi:hypothetical protein